MNDCSPTRPSASRKLASQNRGSTICTRSTKYTPYLIMEYGQSVSAASPRPSSHTRCWCFSPKTAAFSCIPRTAATASKFATNLKSESSLKKKPQPQAEKQPQNRDGDSGGVHVPRQKYIAISKAELLDAILSILESQEQVDQFLRLSSCLDSILHAEHKGILEEMRVDYDLTHSIRNKEASNEGSARSEIRFVSEGRDCDATIDRPVGIGSTVDGEDKIETDKPLLSSSALDLRFLWDFPPQNVKKKPFDESRPGKVNLATLEVEPEAMVEDVGKRVMKCVMQQVRWIYLLCKIVCRVAVATRFQRSFVQLLCDAQFEELSATDLMMTSALNTDYLLTLPIYVDWKRASESKAIIFRRGYATERQKGLLLVEKLDYLQSKLLQGIFFLVSKPLRKIGFWLAEAFTSTSQGEDPVNLAKRIKLWLKEMPPFQQSSTFDEQIYQSSLDIDHLSEEDLPIWLAAQRAVTRYEGILSSVGPRGRLLRKLLMWIGFIPSTPEETSRLDSDIAASEPYLGPIFLSRISLSDIWEPASRKFCGNDLWKMVKTGISIIISQSILQEPAFRELILLYTEETGDSKDKAEEVPSLQLKIYERIPIPDLPVIFPHKKLSFRILDTSPRELVAFGESGYLCKVRLDGSTILGLLAFFINYKFENILSSPSAILLDVIAVSALIIYVSRVVLGYKQTVDRYQLLVNRTLSEKTVASGFGSVHFLLDASEQQQYKEAILAYAMLLKARDVQVLCGRSIGDKCERFLYRVFKEKVEMPADKAMDTLMRLGLVKEKAVDGKNGFHAIPCPEAYEILKQRWNSMRN
ncbi:hypothetical protein RJ639_043936 [Escallonia herrerae]|uniref:Uncharacterized protein n=1 Tax=Escallonia herrerae TaxID=1293975 RepID=A0AA88WFP1_9ASTE|nr:hypothetical protein RJ639_043936 [Escallonia herrerae]